MANLLQKFCLLIFFSLFRKLIKFELAIRITQEILRIFVTNIKQVYLQGLKKNIKKQCIKQEQNIKELLQNNQQDTIIQFFCLFDFHLFQTGMISQNQLLDLIAFELIRKKAQQDQQESSSDDEEAEKAYFEKSREQTKQQIEGTYNVEEEKQKLEKQLLIIIYQMQLNSQKLMWINMDLIKVQLKKKKKFQIKNFKIEINNSKKRNKTNYRNQKRENYKQNQLKKLILMNIYFLQNKQKKQQIVLFFTLLDWYKQSK
ncbi:unnamed protein product [Paramecium sonneborni]|uniref:Uncharacterized protein n=1 Tax=Paramecium sonneborni TaxID=65129 RepID=A0A8S1LDI9_9CILI|nr:unnamed protein product [Paramecium sonneborni]